MTLSVQLSEVTGCPDALLQTTRACSRHGLRNLTI